MARDALHAAVARIHAAQAICSYDGDFDEIAGLRRIEPPASQGVSKVSRDALGPGMNAPG
jgi:hypothetical protein